MAVAKKTELEKMARALGTRGDYQEGDAFDREKQEEARQRRIIEREERGKARLDKAKTWAEDRKRMEEQRKRWQEERRKKTKRKEKKGESGTTGTETRNGTTRREGQCHLLIFLGREQPPRDRDREFSRGSPPHKFGPRGDRRDARDAPPRRNDASALVAEAVRKRERDSLSRSRSRSPPSRVLGDVSIHDLRPRLGLHRQILASDENVLNQSPSRLPQQRRKEETYTRDAIRDRGDGRHREPPPRRSMSPMRGVRRGGRPRFKKRFASVPFKVSTAQCKTSRVRRSSCSFKVSFTKAFNRLGPSGKRKTRV
jgi:serine/arginine repetitive matrix protein 2